MSTESNYTNVATDNNAASSSTENKTESNATPAAASSSQGFAKQVHDFMSAGYKQDLFGCASDWKGFALTCCCPCIVTASAKAVYDNKGFAWQDALCAPSGYSIRQTTRSRYNITPYQPTGDCVGYCCCGPCSLHQEVREIAALSGKPPNFIMEATL